MVDIINYFIPGILLLGFVCSYTDIQKGKIKNWAVISALIYSVVVHILLIIFGVSIGREYIINYFSNLLIAFLAGYILWDLKMWTAGDGKLFFAFSLLVPLNIYSEFIPYFPSFLIFINSVVPIFVYYTVYSLFKTTYKNKLDCIKRSFSIKVMGYSILFIFGTYWILEKLFDYLNIEIRYISLIVIVLMMYLITSNLSSKIFFIFSLVMSLIRAVFDSGYLNFVFLRDVLLISFFFVMIRYIIIDMAVSAFSKKIKIKDLKKGMVISDTFYDDKKDNLACFLKEDIRCGPEGIDKKDISLIKKAAKQKKIDFVRILDTVPFAPFIFSGALITVLIGKNIILFIWDILVKFI